MISFLTRVARTWEFLFFGVACGFAISAIGAELTIIDESGSSQTFTLDGNRSVSLASGAGGDLTLRLNGLYTTVSTNPGGGALAARTPTFSGITQTDGGFTVQIGNHSADWVWSASSDVGSASVSASGLVTVTGLGAGQGATVTVTTTREGYNSGSNTVSGTAKAADQGGEAALSPSLGDVERTADGFTVPIGNYDANWTWAAESSSGAATINETDPAAVLVTVTGLTAGQQATLTVTTTREGYNTGTAQVIGQALSAAGAEVDTSSYCKGSYEIAYETTNEQGQTVTAYYELNDEELVNCYPDDTYWHFDPWIEGTPEKALGIYTAKTTAIPFTLPSRADAADVAFGYLQMTTGEPVRSGSAADYFHVWVSTVPNGPKISDECEEYKDQADSYFYWTQDEREKGVCYLGSESRVLYVNFETRCYPAVYPGGADACNLMNKRKSSRRYLFDVARGYQRY